MVLPSPIRHQDRLLTLNVKREPGISFPDGAPGITVWPLYIDTENSVWVLYAAYAPGIRLPMHYHTGAVHFFTVKGSWHYAEYPDDLQTAGSYLYEPTGSVHSLCIPESNTEDTEGFMVMNGVNVSFDDDGNYLGVEGAGSMEMMIEEWARRNGGKLPRYIKPTGIVDFTG